MSFLFTASPLPHLQEITGNDVQQSRQMLEDNNWNLEVAVEQMLVRVREAQRPVKWGVPVPNHIFG